MKRRNLSQQYPIQSMAWSDFSAYRRTSRFLWSFRMLAQLTGRRRDRYSPHTPHRPGGHIRGMRSPYCLSFLKVSRVSLAGVWLGILHMLWPQTGDWSSACLSTLLLCYLTAGTTTSKILSSIRDLEIPIPILPSRIWYHSHCDPDSDFSKWQHPDYQWLKPR